MVKDIWGCKFVKWVALKACGSSGGIFLLWDTRQVAFKVQWVDEFSVLIVFEDMEIHKDCLISAVHGSNASQRRADFWRELDVVRARWMVWAMVHWQLL